MTSLLVLDDYRCLKLSQATSRRGLAANPTECTLSFYNSDSVVSSAYTISTDVKHHRCIISGGRPSGFMDESVFLVHTHIYPYPQSSISTPSQVVHYGVPPSSFTKSMGSLTLKFQRANCIKIRPTVINPSLLRIFGVVSNIFLACYILTHQYFKLSSSVSTGFST